jgi:precorrin-2/cobalt-factor-2 C20-methyltransferase
MTGTLYGLGVGPGDPELLTLKAHRILRDTYVIAYPQPDNAPSFARSIVAQYLTAEQLEIPIIVPMDVKRDPAQEVYKLTAENIAHHLDAGSDVAVLCEGDTFFYGSFMYLYQHLAHRYPCEIVPGISSVMAASAAWGRPVAARNDVFSVVPAPLGDDEIKARIEASDAVAIMKLGRHFPRVRALLKQMGLEEQAGYCERVSLGNEKVMPLGEVTQIEAPYFSMILIYKGAEGWVNGLPPRARA